MNGTNNFRSEVFQRTASKDVVIRGAVMVVIGGVSGGDGGDVKVS